MPPLGATDQPLPSGSGNCKVVRGLALTRFSTVTKFPETGKGVNENQTYAIRGDKRM